MLKHQRRTMLLAMQAVALMLAAPGFARADLDANLATPRLIEGADFATFLGTQEVTYRSLLARSGAN